MSDSNREIRGTDTPKKEIRGTDTPVRHSRTFHSFRLTRRLPHLQLAGCMYFLTFDSARGPLPDKALRKIVELIKYDNGRKYDLTLAVVMPDHVHMLITPLEKNAGQWFSLSEIVKSVKGASARKINRLLGTQGRVGG